MADASDVSGLLRRWRADSLALSNGAAVSSWPALVGGVALAQATSTNQPSFQISAFGSQPAVRFDGVNDILSATISATSQPVSYVLILKHGVTGGDQQLINNGIEIVGFGGTYQIWGGSAGINGGSISTSPAVVTAVVNGASTNLYLNGTQVSSGNPGTNTSGTGFHVGMNGSSRPLNADVAEILLYDHALTLAERATIHSYIQDRYGITVSDYVASSGPAFDNSTFDGDTFYTYDLAKVTKTNSNNWNVASDAVEPEIPADAIVWDQFDRIATTPGVAPTGQSWTVVSGAWDTDGATLGETNGADASTVVLNAGVTDGLFETRFHSIGGVEAGQLFARSDSSGSNHYGICVWIAGEIQILKSTFTVLAQTAAATYQPGDLISLRITEEATLTRLRAYRNGTEILNVTDNAVGRPNGTYIGYRHASGNSGYMIRSSSVVVKDSAATAGNSPIVNRQFGDSWSLAKNNQTIRPARIAWVGDSIFEGWGATNRSDRPAQKFLDLLRTELGITGGEGYIPSYYIHGQSWKYAFAKSGTITDGVTYGLGKRHYSWANTATATLTATGTHADLLWRGGGGTFTWRVDGGSTTSVNTAANSNDANMEARRTRISLGSAGSHTIQIARTAGTVNFEGAVIYNGDTASGVNLWDWSHSGYYSSEAGDHGFTTLAPHWNDWQPQLVVFELVGANDYLWNKSTPATNLSNVQTLIDRYLALPSQPDVVLVIPRITQGPNTGTRTWNEYMDLIAGITHDRIKLVDLRNNTAVTLGDNVHPNDAGHAAMAQEVYDALAVASVTPVTKSYSSTWNTRAAPTKTYAQTWNTKSVVSTTKASTWNVKTVVAKSYASTWSVRSAVATTKASTWSVRARATKTYAQNWGVSSSVAKTYANIWNVRAAIVKTYSQLWNTDAIPLTSYNITDTIGATPPTVATNDDGHVQLGTEFYVTQTAWATKLRWWQPTTGGPVTTTRTLGIFTVDSASTGTLVVGPLTSTPVGTGWQEVTLPTPYELIPNQRYRVVTAHPNGRYVGSNFTFSGSSNFVSGPLVVPNSTNAISSDQGSFVYPSGSFTTLVFPTDQYQQTYYWSDVVVGVTAPLSSVTSTKPSTWNVLARTAAKTNAVTWNLYTVLAKSSANTWTVRALTTKSNVQSWGVGGSVAAAYASTWNVRSLAAKTYSNAWAVRSTAIKNYINSWNINASVTKTGAAAWDVGGTPQRVTAVTWNVASQVTKTSAAIWTTRTVVNDANSVTWTVRSTVTKTSQNLWNTRSAPVKAYSNTWNDRQLITASKNTLWDTAAPIYALSKQYDSTWGVKAVVAPATNVNVWGVREVTNKAAVNSWIVRSLLSKSSASTWTVRAQITASKAGTWNIRTALFKSYASAWNAHAFVTDTNAVSWNLRAFVTQTYQNLWDTEAIGAVSSTYLVDWNVRARVNTTQAGTWNILTSLGTSKAITWNTRAWTNKSYAQAWNLRALIAKTSSNTWGTRTSLVKASNSVWSIRSQIGNIFDCNWNVRSLTDSETPISWSVLELITDEQSINWGILEPLSQSTSNEWAVARWVSRGYTNNWIVRENNKWYVKTPQGIVLYQMAGVWDGTQVVAI